jgi:glycosyltransferase involved in cell wall biosynthesis
MAIGSDVVIVTNPADARALINEGISVEEIPIGPNLPPPGFVGEPNRDTVAFFGFPARSKGIVELLKALGALSPPRPSLVMIGAQGQPGPANDIIAVAEIDALSEQAGITVRRTGFLLPQEASSALAKAGAIVLPFPGGASLRSGSLLAALQSGRPVVTTGPLHASDLDRLATMPQLLLSPRGDPEALVTAISRALDWTAQAAPLPSEFRWQSVATAHAALYQRLADERRQ